MANIANVAVSMLGTSVWLLWPLLMGQAWGYSQLAVGLAMTPTPVLAGGIAVLVGKRAGAWGYRRILASGAVLLVVANAWFVARLDASADDWGAMLPGLVLFGVGMGLTFAPLNGAALVGIPAERLGQANAAFNTGRFLSGAVGIAAVVAALGDGAGDDVMAPYDRAFGLLVVLSVVAAGLLALAWPRKA